MFNRNGFPGIGIFQCSYQYLKIPRGAFSPFSSAIIWRQVYTPGLWEEEHLAFRTYSCRVRAHLPLSSYWLSLHQVTFYSANQKTVPPLRFLDQVTLRLYIMPLLHRQIASLIT